ncbi:MAG TPA: 50S ribosomal protein L13 [Acidobacteriota bacterium]|nr:50S ribosomal protein L13 [Acidobacteriota bacterium]
MSTYFPKAGEIEKKWFVVDAEGQVLGRLATFVAKVITGKAKPVYTAHEDVGDFVVVVNADKVALTGRKAEQKVYRHHTGYPGGLKTISVSDLQKKAPERVILEAVSGMLPKNKLRQVYLKKLKVYAGSSHPHEAQRPEPLAVRSR